VQVEGIEAEAGLSRAVHARERRVAGSSLGGEIEMCWLAQSSASLREAFTANLFGLLVE